MNVLAILKDFTFRCKSVFENTTTKLSKRFLNWLILTIRTVALIPGKVNFTRLSRYGGHPAKTFASNFKVSVDWIKVNTGIARENFGCGDDVAIAIDPSFISKSGRLTYGMGRFSSLDMSVFTSFMYEDSKGNKTRCHTAVVHSRALRRDLRVVVCPVENGEPLLYFSTDTDMRPEKIIGFYRTRFQIEFGIRDAKQFTGLQSQQTRDKDRLDFAFNLSFTALNVCKEVIRKDYPDLSLAQFKRLMFESYLASTIISTCGKSPHLKIIQKINHRLAQLAA